MAFLVNLAFSFGLFEGREVYRDVTDKLGSLLLMVAPFAPTDELALKGLYQQENLSLALACIETVFPEISKDEIDEGLRNVDTIQFILRIT